jgi:HK97 family phage major capsid protein
VRILLFTGYVATGDALDSFASSVGPGGFGKTEDGFEPGLGKITTQALATVWKANAKSGGIPSGNDFRVPGVGFKDVDASGLLVPAARDSEMYGIPAKPAFLHEIAPSKLITSNDFTYLRQTTRTNLADVVPDGDQKPTSIYKWSEFTGTLDTIAHLSEYIKSRLLADQMGLLSWLNSEMALGLSLAAEAELIATLTADANVLTQVFATDALTSIRKGLTQLQNKFVRPDFLAFGTAEAESLDLATYVEDGRFVFDGPRNAGPGGSIWSVPLVVNPAIRAGFAYMGSAQLALRR